MFSHREKVAKADVYVRPDNALTIPITIKTTITRNTNTCTVLRYADE